MPKGRVPAEGQRSHGLCEPREHPTHRNNRLLVSLAGARSWVQALRTEFEEAGAGDGDGGGAELREDAASALTQAEEAPMLRMLGCESALARPDDVPLLELLQAVETGTDGHGYVTGTHFNATQLVVLEMNGQQVHLIRYDAERSSWQVRLENGNMGYVEPQYLMNLEEPGDSGVDAEPNRGTPDRTSASARAMGFTCRPKFNARKTARDQTREF